MCLDNYKFYVINHMVSLKKNVFLLFYVFSFTLVPEIKFVIYIF